MCIHHRFSNRKWPLLSNLVTAMVADFFWARALTTRTKNGNMLRLLREQVVRRVEALALPSTISRK
jgi:hypothetical protein